MHVQPAQHVALADHLQVVHHGVVARRLGLQHVAPRGGRMRAGGHDGEPVLAGDPRHRLPQKPQLLAGGLHVGMRQRRDLDLSLQQLAARLTAGRGLGGIEKGLGHRAGHRFGVRVDQEELFLDSRT